ncbi:MAG: SUMF1/EgtB/PvdO family nonheme iron enzyme [Planctomycetes bacterium]|nr:SUMF1/EgtB/PvdO family nonheme iron enzyme [Planctomycetota bacterium]
MGRSKKVLIVDSDKSFAKMLATNFKAWGFKPEQIHTGAEALEKDLSEYILVLSELNLPVISGKTLLETYNKLNNKTPVVVITDTVDDELKNQIINMSFVSGWYKKPIDLKELKNYVSEFVFNELSVITQYDIAQTKSNIDDSLNFKLLQRQVQKELGDIAETQFNLNLVNPELLIRQKDDMKMVRISAGTAIIGSREGRDNEKPEINVKIGDFFIDKYPVTNTHYEKFLRWVNTTANPDLYSHPDQPKNKDLTPKYWNHVSLNQPDKPVVGVDWFDAYAYSRWANDVIDCDALPTEFQHEFAVRGSEGRLYPWGKNVPDKKMANFKTMFDGTTSVYQFPKGSTDTGVFDLSGNVWEWCLDWFFEDFYAQLQALSEDLADVMNDAPTDSRVLRGGSFINDAEMLRGSYRGAISPLSRFYHIGFRCALTCSTLKLKRILL